MMNDLLDDIERYCAATGVAPSTLGRKAVRDPGFVTRLRSGGQCLPRTAAKVRAFMAANPPQGVEAAE